MGLIYLVRRWFGFITYEETVLEPCIDNVYNITGKTDGPTTCSKVGTNPSREIALVDESVLSDLDVGSVPDITHDEQQRDIHQERPVSHCLLLLAH
jgi:hypothetical protein